MESRRIILLAEGYLNGWLNFTPKTQLSAIRENYILDQIEKKHIVDILRLKSFMDATLASGNLQEKTIGFAYDSYDRFMGIALPYVQKTDKIESKAITKEEIASWKAILAAKKQEMLSKPETPKVEER